MRFIGPSSLRSQKINPVSLLFPLAPFFTMLTCHILGSSAGSCGRVVSPVTPLSPDSHLRFQTPNCVNEYRILREHSLLCDSNEKWKISPG